MPRPAAHSATHSGSDQYVSKILSALSDRPDDIAIGRPGGGYTRRQCADAIVSAAGALARSGIGPGHTVAVLADSNSPIMLFVRYAANLVGAAVVYLRSTNAASSLEPLPDDQQLGILRETGASFLAVDAEHLERARRLRAALDHRIDLGAYGGGHDAVDLAADDPGAAPDAFPAAADDLAVITYTTGTTGRPKGICRSYRAWRYAVETMLGDEHTNMLVTTPLSHTVGPIADAVLTAGGRLHVLAGFEPGAVLRALAAHRITRVFWATPQVYQVLDHPDLPATDLSSLNTLMYGGIPASPERLAQAVGALGPILVQSYGTTECWEIGRLEREDHTDARRRGSVGRPSWQARVAVRDPDTGRDLAAGEIGEICVSSPGILTEYFRDPERTANTLRGNWFHTGDLGHVDADGYLYLVDRLQHRIKFDGVNVYPAEVEKTLLTHPAVAQAAVFGAPDADRVERIHAAVVLKPSAAATAEALRDHVRDRMSPRHAPAIVQFRGELPVIGSGKIDKQLLRSEAAAP
ncbi:AMP-binding protein [Nocardia wallacei]|uniref:AMP-binding protein n=1 Tax=Nocardia wallacei TaxID=480035 RepID=UPI002457A300|nr:AMP-binding protein [Nocardia wallacei]